MLPLGRETDMGRRGALVGLHGAVLLFGFAGLFGKWLLLPPVWIVLGRTAVAAAALAALRAVQRDALPSFDVRLVANGAVLALHWVAFFAAIQISSVAIGLLGFASFPLFVLVAERVLLGRRWTGREAVVALLVTLGLALLVPEFSLANPVLLGLALGVLSGFTFALLAVMNRRWVSARPATDVAFWQNLWAAFALLPFAAAGGTLPIAGYREIALVLVLGLVCTALAHTLFINCLRTLSAHTASVVAALEPVYGIVLALVLLGEIPGWRTLIGGVLIVGAAIYATWQRSSATGNPFGEPIK
jgi:drug/metabolite transporter (DMT)-like permease